jgi:RHS repeat-associated protein
MDTAPYLLWILFNIVLYLTFIVAFFKAIGSAQKVKEVTPGAYRPDRRSTGVFFVMLLLFGSFLIAAIESNQVKSYGRESGGTTTDSQTVDKTTPDGTGDSADKKTDTTETEMKSKDAPALGVLLLSEGQGESNVIASAQWVAGFLWAQTNRISEEAFSGVSEGSVSPTNWISYGVSERVTLLAETNWPFSFGTGTVGRVYATSFGTLLFSFGRSSPIPPTNGIPDGTALNFIAPLQTVMGIVPTNGAFRYVSGTNSSTFTWSNIYLGRDTNCAATVQAELYSGGDFTFRYHFPALTNNYAQLTNFFIIGAQCGLGGETVLYTNSLLQINPELLPAFELVWKSLAGLDPAITDHDGDGLSTADEFYKHRTDPRIKDTDSDGIGDGLEIILGTNPLLRDSDNDGLVDGSDPDPLQTTSLSDLDNDGIPDAYEVHWFNGTNLINSLSVSYTNTGFSVGVQLLGGMNPTNAAPDAYSPTNTLVSWNLFGSFACDFGQHCTNVIYERTFTINRHGGWQQYFISASPDRAEPWNLEGMTLEWSDSDGTNGMATASPSGDSLRLDLSGGGPATFSLRLRANGSFVRSSKPLYLLAWSPEVTFNPSPLTGETNGVQCLAFLLGSSDNVQVTFNRSTRPHHAPATAEELAETSDPFTPGDGLTFDPLSNGSGGPLHASPGVYNVSGAILSPTNAAPQKLIFASPGLSFDGCSGGCETHLSYDATSNLYSRVYNYPLDSNCLWEGWHRDATGAWSCSCEPEFTLGDESLEAWLSHDVARDGDRASAVVSLGSTQIWEDETWHRRTDTCGESGGKYLSDNGCGGCGGGCAEGNCDEYEGDSLGSLSFRVPLGVPRKGQVSGFLWFRSDGPVTITPALFNLMIRADATTSVTSNNNAVARIVCNAGRGRDVSIQEIAYGVRISVTNIIEGALYSAWEVTNPNGDPSCVNFRRTTRLNNLRRDVTYTYSGGLWTRADNISQTSEQLIISGSTDGYHSEERILLDSANNILSRTFTQYQRVGTRDNAVIRETERKTLNSSGSLGLLDQCSYWNDDLNASRNGKPKFIWGATRPCSYQAWDVEGREILKAEQRDGSNMSISGEPSTLQSFLQACYNASTVTETSYAALAGDTDHAEDADKPRTISVWVAGEGSGTLISRTWYVYTRITTNGIPAVFHRTIRAASASATMNSGLNAVSTETTYAENDAGIPLLLRGRAVSSSDEAGVTMSYSYTFGTFDPSTRVFTEGGATNYVRDIRAVSGTPTQSLTVEDAVQGLEAYSATILASNGTVLDWETRAYDDQNRQRFSAYSDGITATNHYSCCRLLWSRDREGKVTYRNATTGYDHLYYAMEDRSFSNLVSSAAYPVTRHWFDALGRETNTVSASSDGQLSSGSRATRYPFGSSDNSITTDAHGNFTSTIISRYQNYDQTVAGQYAAGAWSPYLVTTATQYRNGPSVMRREWDGKFTQETRATAFDASGYRIESLAIQDSDITGTVTNSVTTFDFLGRTASVTTPLDVTAYTYATDKNRLAYTERTGGPATERTDYHYDDSGEQIGTAVSYGTGLPTASSFSVTSYETVSNEIWRVTRSSRVTDTLTNSLVTAMEQLTGLGSGIIARSANIVNNGGETSVTETAFDPATFVRTTTTTTDNRTPAIQTSKYGYTITSSGLDGSQSLTYDSLGREAVRETRDASNNLLSTSAVSYDAFGNVTTNAITYGQASMPDVMTVTGYDNFGRAVSTSTFTQGQAVSVVTNGYDVAGTLIAQGGDSYPVTFGNDTAGRRTQLTTRYGEADASASTQWKFNTLTGLLTNKLDAAGKGPVYTYTSDGKLLRTTWARTGAWKENAYDQRGLISSNCYPTSTLTPTPNTFYFYNAAGMVSIASNSHGLAIANAYSDALVLTNETISGLDAPGIPFEIERHVDFHQRPSLTCLTQNGTNITQVTYGYDAENRLATMSCTNAQGRGFTLNYGYSGYNGTGFTLTTPTNAVIESILMRDQFRRHQVTDVATEFNGLEITIHSYAFDALGRATNAIRNIQPLSLASTNVYAYNARSEVIGADIEPNNYVYVYDGLGNNLYTSLNSITNAYAVNNLNQYKAVTNLIDFTGFRLGHDADGNTTLINGHYLLYDPENRLFAYIFGINNSTTGTLRSAYVYDYLGRRVKKMEQECKEKDSGGIGYFTYWQTNAVTTYVYDGWNLVHERLALTNGTTQEVSYFWGKDLSGSLQGAGGVGGLLAASIDGDFFFPCYDNNGNITSYIDEGGSVVAYRQYDAFGNTVSKGGDMVDTLHFWYSTKYLDHDTWFYYYGYRYYSPILQRWINRDPIEENDGFNLYNFVSNNSVHEIDPFGLWKKGKLINDGRRRVYIKEANDTFEALAKIVGLNLDEIHKWARLADEEKGNARGSCKVSVPNVWISADLLRGGSTYSEFVSLGGSIGQFFGTDLLTYGFKIEKPTTIQQLASALGKNQKDVWGIAVFGHGDKWGRLGASTTSKTRGIDWIPQKWLMPYVDFNGYRLAKIYMMQCYSKYKGSVTVPKTDVTMNFDFESMWKKRAVENGFFGYSGVNALGIDWH